MMRTVLVCAATLVASVSPAAAQVRAGPLTLSDLTVRASIGAVPNTAGYLTVANSGRTADRLVAASCTCAARVELHQTSSAGGVARMSQTTGFAVPAGGRLSLAPGGGHLMLLGLTRPLRDGETVRLRLRFDRGGVVEAPFRVTTRPGVAAADPHAHH